MPTAGVYSDDGFEVYEDESVSIPGIGRFTPKTAQISPKASIILSESEADLKPLIDSIQDVSREEGSSGWKLVVKTDSGDMRAEIYE